jgi:Fur family ferric uptake transcriptional regulator
VKREGDLLAEAGLRPTRQRLAILRSVGAERRPVTAQELYFRLRRSHSGPGLATVYRTLRSLANAGVLQTFSAGEGQLSYRLCEQGHHHHLICEQCSRVVEIASCEVEGWATSVANRRGFTARRHEANVFGLCSNCRRTA